MTQDQNTSAGPFSDASSIDDFLGRVAHLPVAALLVTDVGREGRLEGIDAPLFSRLASSTSLPVIAAGGVSSMTDLRELETAGVHGNCQSQTSCQCVHRVFPLPDSVSPTAVTRFAERLAAGC